MAEFSEEDKLKALLRNLELSGGGGKNPMGTFAGGRAGLMIPLDESSKLSAGLSGHYAKGKDFKDIGLDQIDATYAKRFNNDAELRAKLRKNLGNSGGEEYIGAEFEIPFKKGGKVKAKSKTKRKVSGASKRGDGIAQRGKTKGRFV